MRRLLFLLPLLLLAACSDSTGGNDPSDELRLTYSGARNGTYQARGAPPPPSGPITGTFAGVYVSGFSFTVSSFLLNGDRKGDRVILALNDSPVAGQTYSTGLSCSIGSPCIIQGVVGFGLDLDDGTSDERYQMTQGTVQVTSVSDTHIRGTFSGTARDPRTGNIITITQGSFDVPIVPGT